MTHTALALAKVIELVTLATEATAAAQRISALIAQRQASGSQLSEEDWIALMNDRQIAQAALLASIVKRQTQGG